MTVRIAVLHRGALASYTVSRSGENRYEAYLLRYNGKKQDRPPRHVKFVKEGRHCSGDTGEQELMDELCYAVKDKERDVVLKMDGYNPTYPMSA